MLGNFGFTEIMMLLLICLVLFGAKRIPEIGSSIGKGIREFKRGVSHLDDSGDDFGRRAALVPRVVETADDTARTPRRLAD